MKLLKKLAKTQKAVSKFFASILKNYRSMKQQLSKIWLVLAAICIIAASCNVTRTVTTESKYFQKGDTSCTIITKTVEQYDATKKM